MRYGSCGALLCWELATVSLRRVAHLPLSTSRLVSCTRFHHANVSTYHRTDKVVLASSGMQADMLTLHKTLRMRLVQYQQTHQKDMSLTAASQMLSNMLYTRRFFPYYTFNVLGGIDENGTFHHGPALFLMGRMCFARVPCAMSLCCLGRVLTQRFCAGKRVCCSPISVVCMSRLYYGIGWSSCR